MAKAKTKTGDFALWEPELSILSDHPLKEDIAYDTDEFNLRYWVGPVYDIIRHEKTDMPMTIAIYGGWGTGKTTAMKWLHGLLDKWNEKPTNGIKVWPVWFYPWKYDNKEDVWRGLIAEVILKTIELIFKSHRAEKTRIGKVIDAAKRFGPFLGRIFLRGLSSLTVTVGIGKVVEVEADLGTAIKNIEKEVKKTFSPEKTFLNEFEETLRKWVEDTLGENERMVVFIDDLDRCMPDIALQVLEALKLYLNIEKLIFVVGVDNVIVEKLVIEHYRRLGLLESKGDESKTEDEKDSVIDKLGAEKYLAKMFQVEVTLAPSEKQINDFFDELIKKVGYWEQLSPDEDKLFRRLILDRAGKNPREIKRLINSAVMRGVGALMQSGELK